MEYILSEPLFSNQTYATIDPALQIQLLCASFTGLGSKCVSDETYSTEGLIKMDVYSNDWVMAGFNSTIIDVFGQGPSRAVPEPGILVLLSCSLLFLWGRDYIKKAPFYSVNK